MVMKLGSNAREFLDIFYAKSHKPFYISRTYVLKGAPILDTEMMLQMASASASTHISRWKNLQINWPTVFGLIRKKNI